MGSIGEVYFTDFILSTSLDPIVRRPAYGLDVGSALSVSLAAGRAAASGADVSAPPPPQAGNSAASANAKPRVKKVLMQIS
jgi:hypothetical protein